MSKRTKKHGRNIIKANRRRNRISPETKKMLKMYDKQIEIIEKEMKTDTILFHVSLGFMLCAIIIILIILFLKFHG